VSDALAPQMAVLARRSFVRTLRQPAYVAAPLVFPLALLALNSAGLHPATNLPGIPTHSFLAFALAVPFVQGALFSAINTGSDLARDIQTGFLSRLSLTPLRGVALLGGYLGGVTALGVVQGVVYVLVGVACRVHYAAGAGGIAMLLVLSALVALAFGTLGALIALRTGSGESVHGLFPLLFAMLLLSSMNLPRNLIEADWFRWLATVNPVSYLLEGIRSLIVVGWDWQALGLAAACGLGVTAVGLALAGVALRTRMTRT
jgi:ABC-2 type transport system permease protein